MSALEAELLSAGLISKPTKKPKKFEATVGDLKFTVDDAILVIENDGGDVAHLTVAEAVKFSEAIRDAMATMISNSRVDF